MTPIKTKQTEQKPRTPPPGKKLTHKQAMALVHRQFGPALAKLAK